MAGANHHRCIKLVLVGDIYVGKTSISRRFIDDIFHDKYQASVGGLFQAKTLREPNVTVQLWDTAGTEKFRALLPHFMRDAMCAILVYDISSRDSFENIKSYWLDFVELNAIPNMVKFLVGNKADVETRAVSDSPKLSSRRFQKAKLSMEEYVWKIMGKTIKDIAVHHAPEVFFFSLGSVAGFEFLFFVTLNLISVGKLDGN